MPKYQLYTVGELASIDELRGYVGRSSAVCVSSGVVGLFSHVLTDTTSADDGVNIIVGNDGRRWYRVVSGGVSSTQYASLNAAVTAIGSARTTLLLVSNLPVTGNVTVPETLSIEVLDGGNIALGDYTVTMRGRFSARRYTCFTYGTGVVAFGPGSVDSIYPEWFGAMATGPSDTPVDSSAAVLQALNCAAAGTIGFTYQVELGQGVYHFASGVDVPAAGVFTLVGQGDGITQIRGMNGGSGYPDYLIKLVSSTYGNRIIKIGFYSGSSSSPMLYGIDSDEWGHVHVEDCSFSYFSRAGIVMAEYVSLFRNIEFANCGVGIWCKRTQNNNDIVIDVCRFVACLVGVATNGGLNVRIRNCLFQGGFGDFAPRTHIYASRVNNLNITDNYFEHQVPGMAGMEFTSPETFRMYAYIILNDEPYMDADGVVTSTLSLNASSPVTGVIANNSFQTGASYTTAGGSGYSAGSVNLEAFSGTGSGATGTAAVSGGKITSVSSISGGTGYRIGDTISITGSGGTGATAMVTGTTGAGVISTITMGQQAAIYMGSCSDLDIRENTCPASGCLVAVHWDRTVCGFGKPILSGNRVSASTQRTVLVVGAHTTELDQRLAQISDNMTIARNADYMGVQNMAAGVALTPSTDPPTASTLTAQTSTYRGLPTKRIALDAAQTTSEKWSGSFTIGTSGSNYADLAGRRIYFTVWCTESGANVKARLTLSANVSGTVIETSNYTSSTSFTSTAGFGREEVSMVMPSATATVTWSIEVIAAAAGAGQYADILGLTIAPVGVCLDSFSRMEYSMPIKGSVSWTPGLLADGAGAETTVTVYGAGLGDSVTWSAPGNVNSVGVTAAVTAANTVTIRAQNESGGNATPASGTWRVWVTPRG